MENLPSGPDDAGGEPFEVDASAEDRVHGLLESPASGGRAPVSGEIQEHGNRG
jgi:hypothetical protein